MTVPINDLLTTMLDANTDTLPGTSNTDSARVQLLEAVQKLQAFLDAYGGEQLWTTSNDAVLAKRDSANTFSAACTFLNVAFSAEIDAGPGANIIWQQGNKQKAERTSAGSMNFLPPSGPTNLVLRLVNAQNFTFPSNVAWPDGVTPALTGTAIVCFYWDGATYHATASNNSQVP